MSDPHSSASDSASAKRPPGATASSDSVQPGQTWTPYQKRLFFFLSVATFFEGYDYLALPQILPNLRQDLGLSPSQGFTLIGVINPLERLQS